MIQQIHLENLSDVKNKKQKNNAMQYIMYNTFFHSIFQNNNIPQEFAPILIQKKKKKNNSQEMFF